MLTPTQKPVCMISSHIAYSENWRWWWFSNMEWEFESRNMRCGAGWFSVFHISQSTYFYMYTTLYTEYMMCIHPIYMYIHTSTSIFLVKIDIARRWTLVFSNGIIFSISHRSTVYILSKHNSLFFFPLSSSSSFIHFPLSRCFNEATCL